MYIMYFLMLHKNRFKEENVLKLHWCLSSLLIKLSESYIIHIITVITDAVQALCTYSDKYIDMYEEICMYIMHKGIMEYKLICSCYYTSN